MDTKNESDILKTNQLCWAMLSAKHHSLHSSKSSSYTKYIRHHPPTPPENLFLLKPWTVSQNLKHCISRGMYGKTFWTSVKLATYKPFLCNASHQPKQGHTRNQFDAKICQTKHSSVQQMMLWVPTRNLVYSFKEENLRL
jgi:hypothetical protein